MTLAAGDFTTLAEDYARHRPDYSATVLTALLAYVGAREVADVGAGTGIWTRMLAERGLSVVAVEPNDAMRTQGQRASASIRWLPGSAEATGLPMASVDWVTMASSFHWAKTDAALEEFHRILRPGGFLTVLWNPRQIEGNPWHGAEEALVAALVPELKRVSSGAARHTRPWEAELVLTGRFDDVVLFEAAHTIHMDADRYLGIWRSVNDIQRQAGPEAFAELLRQIEARIRPLGAIDVPYRTRAWTARRRD